MKVQLAGVEETVVERMVGEREKYEGIIRKLAVEVRRNRGESNTNVPPDPLDESPRDGRSLSDRPSDSVAENGGRGRRSSYDISAAFKTNSVVKDLVNSDGFGVNSSEAVLAGLNLMYKMLCQCADESTMAVYKYNVWLEREREQVAERDEEELTREGQRVEDVEGMEACDGLDKGRRDSLGPHLKPISRLQSRERVTARFAGGDGNVDMRPSFVKEVVEEVGRHPELTDFESTGAVLDYCDELLMCVRKNGEKLELGLWEKTAQFVEVKEELAEDMVERRQREEEVVNWSFVLKYLLGTNSKLRQQLSGRDALRGILEDGSEGGGGDLDVTPAKSNRQQGGVGGVGSAANVNVNVSDMEGLATPVVVSGGGDMVSVNGSINGSVDGSVSTANSVNMSPERVKKLLPSNKVANALIERVRRMTLEDIAKLPEAARANVWQIRREFKMDEEGSVKKVAIEADTPTSFRVSPIGNGGGRRRHEGSDDEEESEDEDDRNFSQI